jgi:hypothetical protein
MEHSSDWPKQPAAIAAAAPVLALVEDRLRLAVPAAPVPQAWQDAATALLAWLGVETEFVASPGHTLFAPWEAWSPAAFQNGGCAALPKAQFVASYGLGDPRAADIMLLSPHPRVCTAGQGAGDALPRAGVMRAMIRAAAREGRRRIAILVHARHRDALARQRLAEDPRLCPAGTSLDILAIEEAIPTLMRPRAAWDAIIAMPDLRGIVLAMLAQATGVRGAWPMLWHGGEQGNDLVRVTSELVGSPCESLPLDATALALGLALTLRGAGCEAAARKLHRGWARLRDSGVATPGRGSDAPYATEVSEAEFIALLACDAAAGTRGQTGWLALENQHKAIFPAQTPQLRIVSSNLAVS